MEPVIIRSYEPSDFENFLRLYQAVFPHKKITSKSIETIFTNPYAEVWFMEIPSQNQLVAFLYFLDVADNLDIVEVGVAPKWRRHGYARRLLKKLLGHADQTNRKVFLEVAQNNTAALALYRSLGFSISGVRKNYYQQQSTFIDAYLLIYGMGIVS